MMVGDRIVDQDFPSNFEDTLYFYNEITLWVRSKRWTSLPRWEMPEKPTGGALAVRLGVPSEIPNILATILSNLSFDNIFYTIRC